MSTGKVDVLSMTEQEIDDVIKQSSVLLFATFLSKFKLISVDELELAIFHYYYKLSYSRCLSYLSKNQSRQNLEYCNNRISRIVKYSGWKVPECVDLCEEMGIKLNKPLDNGKWLKHKSLSNRRRINATGRYKNNVGNGN